MSTPSQDVTSGDPVVPPEQGASDDILSSLTGQVKALLTQDPPDGKCV